MRLQEESKMAIPKDKMMDASGGEEPTEEAKG